MAIREDHPDPLYVVHDDERIIVALDRPGVRGAVEERGYSAVELVRLVPYAGHDDGSQLQDSAISTEPPGARAAGARYGFAALAGVAAGTVVTGAAGPGCRSCSRRSSHSPWATAGAAARSPKPGGTGTGCSGTPKTPTPSPRPGRPASGSSTRGRSSARWSRSPIRVPRWPGRCGRSARCRRARRLPRADAAPALVVAPPRLAGVSRSRYWMARQQLPDTAGRWLASRS